MTDITNALWLFLPAAIANAAPVIANHVPWLENWNTPIDSGRSYKSIRILGDNKRWRGIAFGVLLAGLTGYVQSQVRPTTDMTPFVQTLFAISIGFGALYGDAVESFFKRQNGVKPGDNWFPFDQLDYIAGGLIAALPFTVFGLPEMAAIIAFYFVLHLVTVFVGHRLGIREQPI